MATAETGPRLSAQEHAASFTSKRRTIALIVVSLAFVMDLLDSTIVNIAIPSIKFNLAASYSAIQWVVAGYALTFALLLVTGGRMGDVYGYKKLFLFGIGGFTVASLLSGLAQNPGMLIAARLLQGSMAALMVPQVMSLMQIMYKPEERGAINGLFGALGGLSASLGPVVGGLLIKANLFNLDWRPIFLINVPIGILGLLAAIKYLPDGKSSHPLKLDLTGTGIIVIAMLLLIYPLIQGRDLGWPTWTYIMIAASIPVFIIFALWQKHKEKTDGSPLILPALFKNHSFGVGLSINLVFEMAMIGFFLTFGLLMQIGLGFTALIARHYGLSVHSWQFIPTLLLIGVGMGMVFGSLFAAVLNGVDLRHAGSASGTLNAVQQVGGAIGVALIGVIFFGQLSQAAPTSFNSIESNLRSTFNAERVPAPAQTYIVNHVKECFVDRSREKDSSIVPKSCHLDISGPASSTVAESISANTVQANGANFTNAFRWSIIYAIGLLVITFGMTFLLPKKFKAEACSEI
jgi:MFS family permease